MSKQTASFSRHTRSLISSIAGPFPVPCVIASPSCWASSGVPARHVRGRWEGGGVRVGKAVLNKVLYGVGPPPGGLNLTLSNTNFSHTGYHFINYPLITIIFNRYWRCFQMKQYLFCFVTPDVSKHDWLVLIIKTLSHYCVSHKRMPAYEKYYSYAGIRWQSLGVR